MRERVKVRELEGESIKDSGAARGEERWREEEIPEEREGELQDFLLSSIILFAAAAAVAVAAVAVHLPSRKQDRQSVRHSQRVREKGRKT